MNDSSYKELSDLRGQLISALMVGNRGAAGVLIPRIERLAVQLTTGTAPVNILTAEKKQRLTDALAHLTKAVENVIE